MPKNAKHITQHSSNDQSQPSSASRPRLRIKHFITIIIVVAILVVLIVFAVINLGSTQNEYDDNTSYSLHDSSIDLEENPISNDQSNTGGTTAFNTFPLKNLSTISDTTTPEIVSLLNEDGFSGRTLNEENSRSITESLQPYFADNIPVEFLLLNLNTGYGISYNIDTEIYGASTFKAAYVLYICQNLLETGKRSLNDNITYYLQDDDQSYYAYGSNTLRETIYDCIVESDNGAYISLREAFDGRDFDTWLDSFDCIVNNEESSYFPTYNVRNAAKIWLEIYNYLNTNSEYSGFFKTLLTQTQTSFLREALRDYGSIEIADKAGWYDEGDDETSIYDCVNDSGIITFEGTDYIFCMMTGIADNDITENNFESLTNAIFSARDQLTEETR